MIAALLTVTFTAAVAMFFAAAVAILISICFEDL